MIKIKHTGFIGVLNYIIISFLEIRSSNFRKSKTTLLLFILLLISFRFGFVKRQLLHVLQYLLRLISEIDLEIPLQKDAVEALVAASKFGEINNRKDLFKITAELYKDPEQTVTQAMIVHRDSVLLRFGRKISESQSIIQEFLGRLFTQPNPRLHSLLGLLHLS
jgi:hypothetical protein